MIFSSCFAFEPCCTLYKYYILSIYLSVCLSVYLSIRLSVCPSVRLFVRPSVYHYLSTCPAKTYEFSICLLVWLAVCLSTHPLYNHQSINPSMHHQSSLFQPIELSYVNLVLKQELANWDP